ncbi:MAG: anti-sigma factor antagonist [Chloroflexi bacterium]|nr:anti-sigma factor antagonist [Chloroflexota bacterium]
MGQITVSWQITTDAFIITLHDNGRSFDPQDIAEPESVRLTADLDPTHLRIGGLGIHFMRSLMDEIEYHFDKEQGNTLTMVKYIPSARDERSSIWQEPLPHGLWLVGISGRLDQALIPQLDDVLNNLLEKGHYRILVNLSQTSYINSGGLRCLVSAWRKARKNQGDVVLFGLRGRLVEIFNMVGFYKVFHIYDTRLEAETALRPADGA